jgi:hypothetical protein
MANRRVGAAKSRKVGRKHRRVYKRNKKKIERRIIQSFGHLWERRFIHFGGAGKAGSLDGQRKEKESIDFREQTGIYILYDKDRNPVYIGQAGGGKSNLFSRLKQHGNDHLWNRWEYFSWFGIKKPTKKKVADQRNEGTRLSATVGTLLDELEGLLIAVVEPKLNKQGHKIGKEKEFFQKIHPDLKPLTLDVLMEQLKELKSDVSK